MRRFIVLLLFPLLVSKLYSYKFEELNPFPTQAMLENEKNATTCSSPAPAEETLGGDFRYGCFCGKSYPNIIHESHKEYKELNPSQREELVVQYYGIKPYDDIDALCQQHDICYLYEGKEAQMCNDVFYDELMSLKESFEKEARQQESTEKRCSVLASDMATIFKTIFGIGEDISITRLGTLGMLTPVAIASKIIQKTAQSLDGEENYPLTTEKCLSY